MGTTATVRKKGALQRRKIIERPRLLALLDESKARVRTLVAPAGYGKTTLAEQWVARDGRRGAWYTARRSSTDVAALALGVAKAAAEIVTDCEVRLREHLRAVSASAEKPDVLAEILGEDLATWPSDAWLVLDDYHEIAGADDAERFVSDLLAASSVQMVIASRVRPSWVTARRILYEEVLELNQTALAMDPHEAEEVLDGRSSSSATGLVALANGWPAVIGLAGVSTAEIADSEPVPESLYRFFAEEVFASLGKDVQLGLAALATAPLLDRRLAAKLLGAKRAEAVTAAALDVGILTERGVHLELHPLARSFLEDRSAQLGSKPDPEAVSKCLAYYRSGRDWDAAFDLVVRHEQSEKLDRLMADALDELLEAARLATIEAWCQEASDLRLEAPVFSLARAEIAFRHGRYAAAQKLGEAAASSGDSRLAFRGLSVAGRAAHLTSKEAEAFEHFVRAEAVASSEAERRDALWNQHMCLVDLERPEAVETLDNLRSNIRLSDAREILRAATIELGCQLRLGTLNLDEAEAAYELLPTVTDPLVSSSFKTIYAWALGLAARYDSALMVGTELLEMTSRYRLDFARPYAMCATALASAGLRRWNQAEAFLLEAEEHFRANRNLHGEQMAYPYHVRLLVQQGKFEAALALDIPSLQPALAFSMAEVLAARALVLAAVGRTDEALTIFDDVRGTSQAIEPVLLLAATKAISALKLGESDATAKILEFEEAAFSRGALDVLVTVYRSTPEVLAIMLQASSDHSRLADLLKRAGDLDLARSVGQDLSSSADPRLRLSRREREVFHWLRQGLKNREIAKLLFISESTVKVHVHHIYDKLGTRSRTALTVQAALERSDQATSAMDEDGSGDS
jgi:ATP/maltotriose-dependent transcriptional regulator MalT